MLSSQIVRVPSRFIGWFADLTALVTPGTEQTLHLTLPDISSDYSFSGGDYVHTGGELGTRNLTLADARSHCDGVEDCMGFTVGNGACARLPWTSASVLPIFFKARTTGGTNSGQTNAGAYCCYAKPAQIDGVFFENVEPVATGAWRGE